LKTSDFLVEIGNCCFDKGKSGKRKQRTNELFWILNTLRLRIFGAIGSSKGIIQIRVVRKGMLTAVLQLELAATKVLNEGMICKCAHIKVLFFIPFVLRSNCVSFFCLELFFWGEVGCGSGILWNIESPSIVHTKRFANSQTLDVKGERIFGRSESLVFSCRFFVVSFSLEGKN